MKRLPYLLVIGLFWLVGILLHAWAVLAVFYCAGPGVRWISLILYFLVIIFSIVFSRRKTRGLLFSLMGFLLITAWFISIKPNPQAVYPDNLKLARVEFNGDSITLHNVRNCKYRSKDDFDVRYETRTYDLKDLKTLDLMVNYWGISAIAHTFLSFGFSGGRYLSFSIEIRPEVGEVYDMIKGFFKQ